MNDKNFNSTLLIAILLTLVAVFVHPYLPQRHLLATADTRQNAYIYSSTLRDGTASGSWLDDTHRSLQCRYTADTPANNFSCSFNLIFAHDNTQGEDLSRFDRVDLDIQVRGPATKLRLYMRNFSPAYTHEKDSNSTKFNTIILSVDELHQPLSLPLDELTVADWWLDQYQIPRQLARPEFSNILSLGLDFYYPLPFGSYQLTVNKIDFVGEWVSAEHWYLGILGCWMLGIFSYALSRLIQLSRQTSQDTRVINMLTRDREQLRRESEQFRQLSNMDVLTQIYNRRGMEQIIASLFGSGIVPPPEQFVLILGDIDYFKRINDNRGHDVGDKVLQQVSHCMQAEVRASDFLGRWGGEEFIILVPYESLELGVSIAERIRQRIAKQVFEPDQPLSVTMSFGIGSIKPGETFEDLFKRVDEALYQAKTDGRNCCISAP